MIQASGMTVAAGMLGGFAPAIGQEAKPAEPGKPSELPARRIQLAVKYGMIQGDMPMVEKFKLLQSIGFDGVEMDSPNNFSLEEVLAAREASGLRIHGVVDSVHWRLRLSSPDSEERRQGIEGLITAIRDSKAYGGSSVLLVPGRVADPQNENQDQVWKRSIEAIKTVLPLAAELGIYVLIENVWNGFCYDPEGGDDQSADLLASYVDEIGSPWVANYLDLGNHRKFAKVESWVRTLGRRVVKVDVKDWGKETGWTKIGEGDIDWPAVRQALADVGYTGWATAEVAGGGRDRLVEIKSRMEKVLFGEQ